MLKITTVREDPQTLRVHLHGQFTGEYVAELEKTMSAETTDVATLALDLSNVTFVDREAMMFLCGAKSRNVVMENVPLYVILWIEQEDRCGAWRFKRSKTTS